MMLAAAAAAAAAAGRPFTARYTSHSLSSRSTITKYSLYKQLPDVARAGSCESASNPCQVPGT